MRFFSLKSVVTAVVFLHRRGRTQNREGTGLRHQRRGAARCALFGQGKPSPYNFPLRPSLCSRGFTLLEILIVMILIALIAGIGIPRFIGSLERAEVKSAAAKVAGVMRRARLTAVSEKVPVTVEVDTKSRTVRAVYITGDGEKRASQPVAIPAGVIVWTGHSGNFYHRPLSIEFAPTGSSTGGELLIAAVGSSPGDSDGYLVRLNPLSGRTIVIPASEREDGK